MRSRVAAVLLPLALLASSAARAGDDTIGLYADEAATLCAAPLVAFQPLSVYVIATLDDLDWVMAAEFAIAGFPGSPGYPLGSCTPHWASPLVIGETAADIAIAFPQPLAGPAVLLGRLEFLAYGSSWVGANHGMQVVAGSAKDAILLVDGDAVEREVRGGRFTFNCSANCDCGPSGTASLSFSEVKELY